MTNHKPPSVMQARFIDEYLVDLNGAQAAIRAGYSEKNAREQASRLLSKANIRAEIDRRKNERSERTAITADRILQELGRIALFDARKLLRDDGSPKPLNELDDDTAAVISGLDVQESYDIVDGKKVFTGYIKKYKVSDKNVAITNAMRHLSLFNDKLKVEATDLSIEALDARFAEKMRLARERQKKVLEERGLLLNSQNKE